MRLIRFKDRKPKKDEVIGFKDKNSHLPELGIFQVFNNGENEEIYVYANDDVAFLEDVEYWFEVPQPIKK